MLAPVKAKRNVPRQNLVRCPVLVRVFLVDGARTAPLSRAVFFAPPIIPVVGEKNAYPHTVGQKKNEDSFCTVLA